MKMGRIAKYHAAKAERLAKEAALERAKSLFAACMEALDYHDHFIELAISKAEDSATDAGKVYLDQGLTKAELARLGKLAKAVQATYKAWQEVRA